MIAIILYYYIYLIIYRGKTKASRSKGRGRTKAKDVSDLFARSSPLFCSVCCPRRPHHRQPLIGSNHQQRRGTDGHLVQFWAMQSPPHRHTSPPIDQQKGSASFCLSSCPPRPLPRPLPLHQVVRVGKRAIQGGRSPPAHPADPLHPAGVCGRIYRKV